MKEFINRCSKKLMEKLVPVSRTMMALIFIVSGLGKLISWQMTVDYLEVFGIPSLLLPIVVSFELMLGSLLIVGWRIKLVAIGLASFSLIAAIIFHSNFSQSDQIIAFLKNLAIAGGLLLLVISENLASNVNARK